MPELHVNVQAFQYFWIVPVGCVAAFVAGMIRSVGIRLGWW